MDIGVIAIVWAASLFLASVISYTFGWERKADDGAWCKSGKHFFATWKPCPCCIGDMIDDYKQKHGS